MDCEDDSESNPGTQDPIVDQEESSASGKSSQLVEDDDDANDGFNNDETGNGDDLDAESQEVLGDELLDRGMCRALAVL
jgi:hypothetical protein